MTLISVSYLIEYGTPKVFGLVINLGLLTVPRASHGKPMGTPRTSCRQPMGISREAHEQPTGSRRAVRRLPTASPRSAHGHLMAIQWATQPQLKGVNQWSTMGSPPTAHGHPRERHVQPMAIPWASHGHLLHGPSTRTAHGIPMSIPSTTKIAHRHPTDSPVASARRSGQEDCQRGTPPVSLASCSISPSLRAFIITE